MVDRIRRGPEVGRRWPSEVEEYEDPETGARVRRLTDSPGDDYHLYFTEPCWYDDGRRLLFRSDRGGETTDLYSIELASGAITRLTDLPEDVGGVTYCPVREAAYFWHGRHLVSLDVDSLAVESLYERPSGYGGSVAAATADGERVVTAISERVDVPREGDRDSWIAARMAAAPHSQVLSVPADGLSPDEEPTVHVDEDRWLNHVNASPTRPELVTYCQEGPWEEVDRIWGLDLDAGETWRIRPAGDGEAVGHEYWLDDGEYVGYHGWRGTRDDPEAFFGQVRYDDEDRREHPAPDIYTHFHSNTRELIVGDGTHRGVPYDLLWEWDADAGEYATPRKLASHGWSGDDDAHPHSRLSPDGTQVVFDSTRGGDGSDVYLVDVPDDLDDLPRYEGETA